jgi:cytochrome c-type biogenesis protein CcmH/NrfF
VNLLCRTFLVAITLTPLMLSAGDDASRLHSLTTKVFCNCGCREILSECSHPECTSKVPLKQEIAAAVRSDSTDDEILGNLEKKYGANILLVPSFRGFNVLLWIVPLAAVLIALAIFVWRRWSHASEAHDR